MVTDSRGEPCPWGVSREPEVDDSPQPFVWVVEDSERHWVVARSQDEAIRLVAEAFEFTPEEFVEEGNPTVTLHDPSKPVRVYHDACDVPTMAKQYPSVTKWVAEIPASQAAKHLTGMICSTVW